MRSTYITKISDVERKWFVVDATDKTLGRLSSQIAHILRGKHKPIYSPSVDTGDFVIVINAEKIKVTGNKLRDKIYYTHSGYLGHQKQTPLKDLLSKKPEDVIYLAVKGMLPKSILGKTMLKKLRVYKGETHNHQAQQPEVLDLK